MTYRISQLKRISYCVSIAAILTALASLFYRDGGEIIAYPGHFISFFLLATGMMFMSDDNYPPLIPWQFASFFFYSALFFGISLVYSVVRRSEPNLSGLNVKSPIPEFGERVSGVEYILRPSSYVVALNSNNEIAVVTTPLGYFLPGGGQQPNEAPPRAAVREALEEYGLRVDLDREIGIADELVFAPAEKTYCLKRSTFFSGRLFKLDGGGEADHHLTWMSTEEALNKLSHKSHSWASCITRNFDNANQNSEEH